LLERHRRGVRRRVVAIRSTNSHRRYTGEQERHEGIPVDRGHQADMTCECRGCHPKRCVGRAFDDEQLRPYRQVRNQLGDLRHLVVETP